MTTCQTFVIQISTLLMKNRIEIMNRIKSYDTRVTRDGQPWKVSQWRGHRKSLLNDQTIKSLLEWVLICVHDSNSEIFITVHISPSCKVSFEIPFKSFKVKATLIALISAKLVMTSLLKYSAASSVLITIYMWSSLLPRVVSYGIQASNTRYIDVLKVIDVPESPFLCHQRRMFLNSRILHHSCHY